MTVLLSYRFASGRLVKTMKNTNTNYKIFSIYFVEDKYLIILSSVVGILPLNR